MAANTIFVRTEHRPSVCVRCRERSRNLQTPERLCLACIEYLVTEGGKWAAGDDTYMPAVREWLKAHGCRYEELPALS
jgi:hypothetical protein